MKQQIYKKVGRKYLPIGYSDGFTGFPCEGIWIVYDTPNVKSQSCIAQVGQFEDLDYSKLASLIKHKEDECLQAMDEILTKGNYTRAELLKTIFKVLCKNTCKK